MRVGNLVKWTFARTSSSHNKENNFHYGVLVKKCVIPKDSWFVLISSGDLVHGDITEIDLIGEN